MSGRIPNGSIQFQPYSGPGPKFTYYSLLFYSVYLLPAGSGLRGDLPKWNLHKYGLKEPLKATESTEARDADPNNNSSAGESPVWRPGLQKQTEPGRHLGD